jgi:hypothetical protein
VVATATPGKIARGQKTSMSTNELVPDTTVSRRLGIHRVHAPMNHGMFIRFNARYSELDVGYFMAMVEDTKIDVPTNNCKLFGC